MEVLSEVTKGTKLFKKTTVEGLQMKVDSIRELLDYEGGRRGYTSERFELKRHRWYN